MKRAALLFLLLPVLSLGSLATAAMFFELGPSKVIYPEQHIPLIFDHDYHVRKKDEARGIDGQDLSCDFCHEDLESSMSAADRHIPGHDVCELCHDDWIGDEEEPAPVKECARCHGDLDPAGSSTLAAPMHIPAPNIEFAHGIHLKAGASCGDCHPNVQKKKLAVRDDYPTMDQCISCHAEALVSVECGTCHFEGSNGKILQSYPSGQLKPQRYHAFAIHDESFLRDHAVPAQREHDYCETCHSESDCMECHDGIARDFRYHPDAWMAQHSIRARIDDMRCQSCHRLQSFCLSCHVRSGVASAGPVSNPLNRRTIRLQDPTSPTSLAIGPHPMAQDGWLDSTSRNFHGFHAQRNIRACASCHQEQYCIQCHRSSFSQVPRTPTSEGGNPIAANPHGPNAARLRGSLAARQNARACLKCHSPADPSWR